jgi:hypothetical protein
MATIPDDELVEAALDRLEGALPAALAAAALPAVREFLDYDPSLLSPAKAPTVFVDLTRLQRSGSEDRGATLKRYSVRPQLLVGVTAAGNDASTAARQLRKTAHQVRQVLEGDQTLGGRALWVAWQETDYTPNLAQGTALYKIAFLTFDLNYRTRLGEE